MSPAPHKSSSRDRARRHRHTRKAHSTETAEDYVELIAELIQSQGEARVVELARSLGVTHVTVVRTVARLKAAGLLETKPYRAIFLTPRGQALAGRIRRRHQIVEDFLCHIGVSKQVAQADAEGLEHHISEETLATFERFIQDKGEKIRLQRK